jgi:ribokinase
MEKKRILVIGSSNVDLIMKMDRLPNKGETVTDCEFLQTFGGKGANQAVAAARAGGRVTFVSCVGNDHYGISMIGNYKKDGINTDHIFTIPDVPSGTALIMIGGDGDNYLSVAPGANYELKRNHIDQVQSIISESDIILLQYEILTETLEYILEKASGKTIILNLAPAKPLDDYHLKRVSILVVNETEAQFISGISNVDYDNASVAAGVLHDKGVLTVIVTLGVKGSYISSNDFTGYVEAFPVNAIDATAAGDVYCGNLATGLANDLSLKDAVRFSSAASALCVTKLGAQPSAPTKSEIDGFLINYFS